MGERRRPRKPCSAVEALPTFQRLPPAVFARCLGTICWLYSPLPSLLSARARLTSRLGCSGAVVSCEQAVALHSPGFLRMVATVPSVMDSPMLGTATVCSASRAAEVAMLRSSTLLAAQLLLAAPKALCWAAGWAAPAGARRGRRGWLAASAAGRKRHPTLGRRFRVGAPAHSPAHAPVCCRTSRGARLASGTATCWHDKAWTQNLRGNPCLEAGVLCRFQAGHPTCAMLAAPSLRSREAWMRPLLIGHEISLDRKLSWLGAGRPLASPCNKAIGGGPSVGSLQSVLARVGGRRALTRGEPVDSSTLALQQPTRAVSPSPKLSA